jgi:phosphopantetheinyl transferase (holo-ACP synthase)
MTILGIGVDVVYTPRIAALIARRGSRRLATRILSPKEFTHWESRPQPDSDASSHTRFFAVRYGICYLYKFLF